MAAICGETRVFFVANSITTPEKKRAVFLSVIGPSTYKKPRVARQTWRHGLRSAHRQVIASFQADTVGYSRCRFHSQSRRPGESVCTFVSELRSLSEFCKFGGSLDVMIRDHPVCGINDDGMQKQLLSEPGLTYAKAVEISQGIEMAAQNVKDTKRRAEASYKVQPYGGQEVHALSGAGSRKPPPTCFVPGSTLGTQQGQGG